MIKGLMLVCLIFLVDCSNRTPVTSATSNLGHDIFQSRQASFGTNLVNYRVYVPSDRSVGERLPVLLYLHGSDDRGNDNEKQLNGLAGIVESNPKNFRMIVVVPQCEAGHFWDFGQINRATIALHDAIDQFDGDESRIYLAGHSLGAYGVWSMAVRQRYNLAAIVPLSGRVLPRPNEKDKVGDEVRELVDAPDPYEAFAKRLGDLPVWVFHGTDDKIVPIEGSRKMVQALSDAGNSNVRFSELPGVGHNTVTAAFENPDLFEWLAKQQNKNISYENVNVTDDIVYHEVLESIVYDGELPFGQYYGSTHLVLSGETTAADDSMASGLAEKVPTDIIQNFDNSKKIGISLRDSDYGVHYPLFWQKPARSLMELFEREKRRDPEVKGVIGLSTVGYDSNHSRALVYVEFINSEKQTVKKYCMTNWKRDGHGLGGGPVKWIS